jgi:hypothetical protein
MMALVARDCLDGAHVGRSVALYDLHRGHSTYTSLPSKKESRIRFKPNASRLTSASLSNRNLQPQCACAKHEVGITALRDSPLGHRCHTRSESRLSVAVCKPWSTCTSADNAARARTSAGVTSPWLAKTQAKTRDDLRKDAIVSREMIHKVAGCVIQRLP